MTKKSLAVSKACFSLAIFTLFFAFTAFVYFYGGKVVQEIAQKVQEETQVEGQINIGGLGPAVGFIITAAVVWAQTFFDVVIRSTQKIEDNLDIPVLGVIPRHEISSAEEGR